MRERLDRATIITLVIAAVFAFAIGLTTGFIGGFTHRLTAPWGLLAGIAIVVALVAGFRLVFGSRIIAGAAAAGAVVATGLLTLPGAGGVVLVLDDPLGWIWALAPLLLSAVIIALPRRSRIEAP